MAETGSHVVALGLENDVFEVLLVIFVNCLAVVQIDDQFLGGFDCLDTLDSTDSQVFDFCLLEVQEFEVVELIILSEFLWNVGGQFETPQSELRV